jgi:hypothetical protein
MDPPVEPAGDTKKVTYPLSMGGTGLGAASRMNLDGM